MEQLEGDLGVPLPALQIDKPLRMAELTDLMRAELAARYEVIEERFGSQALREQERWMTIQAMDRSWTEHLESLVDLQQDIDLVACGEQSPWNAYQEKATEIFAETRGVVARDVAQDLFGEILREVPHNPSDAA
jgi:preprotein translocase subunit SecA